MSETTLPPDVKKFCKVWVECLAEFLGSLGVVSPTSEAVDTAPAPAPAAEELQNLVCMRFTVGGVIKGELLWVSEKPAALQLSQLLMSEPLNPAAEFGETQRDAFAELLRQVAGLTAAAWNAESGSAIELTFQTTAVPAKAAGPSATFHLKGDKFPELSLRLFLDEELCAALAAQAALAAAPSLPEPVAEAAPVAPPIAPVQPPALRTTPLPANLALVLDVELEATIRFGERHMLLRDIFGLVAGAVVELDQMVNEPAQLLVAGRLVARGEVVVVDGNFGLRVTEVASVNDRASVIPL
jgi:flagellar motor switch protein FliN